MSERNERCNGQHNAQESNILLAECCTMPLVDAHMHIQSNDIAPLPIMRGLAYLNGARLRINAAVFSSKLKLRNKINYHELSFREMKKFPEPDDISPTVDARTSLFGNFFRSVAGNNRQAITDRVAGFVVSFFTKDYGKVARNTTFNIAGMYMNEVLINSVGYSSRRSIIIVETDEGSILKHFEDEKSVEKSEETRHKLLKKRERRLGNYQKIISGYYTDTVDGVFEFSIVLGMELMYAHYWGAYGIPIYIRHDGKLYYIGNDLSINIFSTKKICHTAYDISRDTLRQNYNITDKNGTVISTARNRNNMDFFDEKPAVIREGEGYKHYLVPVRDEEIVQYEDFKQHLEYSEMAAMKYPFNLLPFYHFDPRRFFTPDINVLLHEFYQSTDNNHLIQFDTNEISNAINSNSPFKYKYKIDELKNKLMASGNSTGLFWGIKMYLALGYPPYMENSEDRVTIFPHTGGENLYNGLTGFYEYCADNDIPVTCHCSPQGMTIADPGIYLKEYLKQQPKSTYHRNQKVNFPVGEKQFIQGLGLIDDFSSPESWQKVLENMGGKAKKFRLCLAHYGGMGFLSGEFNDTSDSPYCWYREISDLIEKYDQVYADLSCFTLKNIPDLLPAITDFQMREYARKFPVIRKIYINDNRARDYIINTRFQPRNDEEKEQILALRVEMIEDNKNASLYKKVSSIVDKLATEIERNDKDNGRLRYRLLFGTDWPMSEMNVSGITDYKASMFIMLQLLTKRLGGKWDAWHQFTVINPLRFLGLLDEVKDENSVEELSFKFEKLTTYNEHLNRYLENVIGENEERCKRVYNLEKSDLEDEIKRKYEELKKKYETKKIPTASSKYLRKGQQAGGRLKILGDER